jgi:hypothetical protein
VVHGEGRGAVRRRRRRETKRGRGRTRDGENGGRRGEAIEARSVRAQIMMQSGEGSERGGTSDEKKRRRVARGSRGRLSRRQSILGPRQAARPRVRRGRAACGAKKLRRQARDDNERRWRRRSETKLTTDEPRDLLVDPPHRTAQHRPTRRRSTNATARSRLSGWSDGADEGVDGRAR